MAKAEILESLSQINIDLRRNRSSLNHLKEKFISKRNTRDIIQKIATIWFENVEMQLNALKIDDKIIGKYHKHFDKLLRLTLTNSRKTSYIATIDEILNDFNSELIVQVMKSTVQIQHFKSLEKSLTNVTKKEEVYLQEAIGCANNNFLKASVVLGWSAAIHRIHKNIERLGFEQFNAKSQEMKEIDSGRYKRFTKSFTVHNFAELQATIFDNDILWVLEYWGLIDSNQHERLMICFTMRNNSGHPGDATISPENLVSFYSDLDNNVFKNKNFPPIE